MAELKMLIIERNESPYFIYSKYKSIKPEEITQCELQSLEFLIKTVSDSDFSQINLKNGYILKKNKTYTNGENSFELSFKEIYSSTNKSLKEQSHLKEKMDNHIKKFEEIISDSIYILSTPFNKFEEFKQYLSSQ
jgi:uncharacterized protein HemY